MHLARLCSQRFNLKSPNHTTHMILTRAYDKLFENKNVTKGLIFGVYMLLNSIHCNNQNIKQSYFKTELSSKWATSTLQNNLEWCETYELFRLQALPYFLGEIKTCEPGH